MFPEVESFMHSAAFFIIMVTLLYTVLGLVYLLFRLFTYSSSQWKIAFKRFLMAPTIYLRDYGKHGMNIKQGTQEKIISRAIALALLLLVALEGIAYSGLDTNIGSYTEYHYNTSRYYVMVYGSGTKYYRLPAIIHRRDGDNGAYHCIEKAFWPNGGYITFSGDESSEVKLNQITTVSASDPESVDVMLTSEKCEDSEGPELNVLSYIVMTGSALACVFLLILFIPLQYPNFKYDD